MFTFFSCGIDFTVTQKWGIVFSRESKSLYLAVLFTPTIIVFLLFVSLKWLKKYVQTQN